MKITEAFQHYIDERLFMRGASLSTTYHYEHCRDEAVFFFGNVDVSELTVSAIRKWETELLKKRGHNTVRGYVTQLRCVLKYCNTLGVDCIDGDLIPVAKRRTVEMSNVTAEEVDQLIDATPRLRTKFVIAFLASSGVRVSEFCSLNRDQIKDRKFTVIGKGNKERICFIDERAEALMNAYLATRHDDCEALLVCEKKQVLRVSKGTVQLIVKNAAKAAGFAKRVTPHTFRHGYATQLIKNGAPIPAVSKLLGHANVETTMVYTHFANPALQETYEKYHKNRH